MLKRGEDVARWLGARWRAGAAEGRRRLPEWLSILRNDRQVAEIHRSMLAREQDRTARPLLLRKTANLMIESVVDPHVQARLHGESSGNAKISVANRVLGTGGVRSTEILRPPIRGRIGQEEGGMALQLTDGLGLPCIPSLTLRLKAAAAQKAGLVCQNAGNFVAKGIHAVFQSVI